MYVPHGLCHATRTGPVRHRSACSSRSGARGRGGLGQLRGGLPRSGQGRGALDGRDQGRGALHHRGERHEGGCAGGNFGMEVRRVGEDAGEEARSRAVQACVRAVQACVRAALLVRGGRPLDPRLHRVCLGWRPGASCWGWAMGMAPPAPVPTGLPSRRGRERVAVEQVVEVVEGEGEGEEVARVACEARAMVSI